MHLVHLYIRMFNVFFQTWSFSLKQFDWPGSDSYGGTLMAT